MRASTSRLDSKSCDCDCPMCRVWRRREALDCIKPISRAFKPGETTSCVYRIPFRSSIKINQQPCSSSSWKHISGLGLWAVCINSVVKVVSMPVPVYECGFVHDGVGSKNIRQSSYKPVVQTQETVWSGLQMAKIAIQRIGTPFSSPTSGRWTLVPSLTFRNRFISWAT